MITDTTFFTNEPGYALLDRFIKTLKHIGSRFPESALLKVNKNRRDPLRPAFMLVETEKRA